MYACRLAQLRPSHGAVVASLRTTHESAFRLFRPTATRGVSSLVPKVHRLQAEQCNQSDIRPSSSGLLKVPVRSLATQQTTPNKTSPPTAPAAIRFDDAKLIYGSRSLFELVRALAIFRLCGMPYLVDNAESLLKKANKILGRSTVDVFLRHSFFAHFCAGEDEPSIRPSVEFLRRHGVGSILDYAAEADIQTSDDDPKAQPLPKEKHTVEASRLGTSSSIPPTSSASSASPSTSTATPLPSSKPNQPARVYNYVDEENCDKNLKIFKECVTAVHNVTPEGFAAVKLTALGVPALLQRLSTAITQTRALFVQLDAGNKGYLTLPEFAEWYRLITGEKDTENAYKFLRRVKPTTTSHPDRIDYEEWMSVWSLQDVWAVIRKSAHGSPLLDVIPTDDEVVLMNNMYRRIREIGEFARENEVRLMIDAEQTYFQPAIDHATHELQYLHNFEFPTIFGTYQCYLKDSHSRVLADLARAKRLGHWFCAKIVRGAYMDGERKYALENNLPYPIFDTLQETHDNYNKVAELLITTERRNLIIASHNQQSIELATACMKKHNIDPADGGVYFGQLLGMSDHLTFSLGLNGYKAYKYVPYGPVHEVIPYLLRRAQENRAMFKNAAPEIDLLKREVRRRLNPFSS